MKSSCPITFAGAEWNPLRPGRGRLRGQRVVRSPSELDEVLAAVDNNELVRHGLVIEENLTEVTTYSVGLVPVADLVPSYQCSERRPGAPSTRLARDRYDAAMLAPGLTPRAKITQHHTPVFCSTG